LRSDDHLKRRGTYLVSRIRAGRRKRWQARVGVPDRALTPGAGLAAVSELCDRLGVIEAIDAAVGPVRQRNRGYGAGELLTGIAAAQLAGEIVLLDWEDVSAAPGVLDLAWLLLSSVEPAQRNGVIAAYAAADHLAGVLPVVIVQGLLSLADTAIGSADAAAWINRLDAAADRFKHAS
jgi:hypothetical protein